MSAPRDDWRTVYRVEDDGGCGPFTTGHGRDFHNTPDFRAPKEEPRLRRRWWRGDLNLYRCGFADLDEARRWFPPDVAEDLAEYGFRLTTWEVPRSRIAYGRDQVLFDPAAGTCISVEPLQALHT